MKNRMFLQTILHRIYSHLIVPLGFLAITLVATQNLSFLNASNENRLVVESSPRSHALRLQDNLNFQRFVSLRTPKGVRNQCLIRSGEGHVNRGGGDLF